MGMMKQRIEDNYFVKVTNIKWNEGPKYRGQKEFWFMITPSQLKDYGGDLVNNMALFQEIENQLPKAGEYGGIVSDDLESEVFNHNQVRAKYPKYSIDAVDLTETAVENIWAWLQITFPPYYKQWIWN